jgi:hypothetical protein
LIDPVDIFLLSVDKLTDPADWLYVLIICGISIALWLSNKTHKMKKILLAVVFGVASLSSINTQAQVSVNINIGSQPQWGPAGYDHVDYYYLPDIDTYYNVPNKQYIYLNNGNWVFNNSLPSRYRNYDLYNSYKVVINSSKPYLSHKVHVKEYSKYKGYKGKQRVIRDSRSIRQSKPAGNKNKYREAKGNSKSREGKGNGKHGNGSGNNGKH